MRSLLMGTGDRCHQARVLVRDDELDPGQVWSIG